MNLTSLIDVVFILLVFFMLTTQFRRQELPLELPKAEGQDSPDLQSQTLSVDRQKRLQLDDRAVTLASLAETLRQRLDGGALELAIDQSLDFAFVLKILKQVQDAGVENVRFQYEASGP